MSDGVWRDKRCKSTVCGSIVFLADTANQNLAHPVHKVYIYLLSLLPSAGRVSCWLEANSRLKASSYFALKMVFCNGNEISATNYTHNPNQTNVEDYDNVDNYDDHGDNFCKFLSTWTYIYYLLTTRQIFTYLCIQ